MELHLSSGFLLLLTLTIILRLQTANSKIFFSHLGEYCYDSCRKSGDEFRCKVIKQNGNTESQYCSPKEDLDYQGHECKKEFPCSKYGQSSYWCYVKSETVMYIKRSCGLVGYDFSHFTTMENMICKDVCYKRSTGSFQCDTGISHDYCSPDKNVDYYGRKCEEDHPCGQHGENYHWCYLERGGWEKCGMIEHKVVSHRTRSYEALCLGECLAEGTDYFWCETLLGWDYCSPLPDVTYRNVPCRANHPCDLHGKNYYWCYTESSWDYCGQVESNLCAYEKLSIGVKTLPNSELFCHDDRKQTEIRFIVETEPGILSDSKAYFYETHMMINQWNNDLLDKEDKAQLLSSIHGKVHLFNQGFTNVNDIQYQDYQIQTTKSALIAQILIPKGIYIPAKFIRRALVESLYRHARITIRLQPLSRQREKLTLLDLIKWYHFLNQASQNRSEENE